MMAASTYFHNFDKVMHQCQGKLVTSTKRKKIFVHFELRKFGKLIWSIVSEINTGGGLSFCLLFCKSLWQFSISMT